MLNWKCRSDVAACGDVSDERGRDVIVVVLNTARHIQITLDIVDRIHAIQRYESLLSKLQSLSRYESVRLTAWSTAGGQLHCSETLSNLSSICNLIPCRKRYTGYTTIFRYMLCLPE
jgi:hypothetical protein